MILLIALFLFIFKYLWHLYFAAAVAAVGVVFNLYVGFLQVTIMWQVEADVLDSETALQPLLLIMGLYFKYVIGKTTSVEVGCVNFSC